MTPTKKIYYLSSCDTCQRILHELRTLEDFIFQDVKEELICENDLDFLKNFTGKYELLFNKRAKLYKERNLNKQSPGSGLGVYARLPPPHIAAHSAP